MKIIYSFIFFEKYIFYDFISALKCSAFPLMGSLEDPPIIWLVCFLRAIVLYTELLFLFSMKLHFTNPAFAVKGHHSHSWNFIQWTVNLEYYENLSSIIISWTFTQIPMKDPKVNETFSLPSTCQILWWIKVCAELDF